MVFGWCCSDLFVFIFILPPFNGKLMFHLIHGNKNVSKIEIAVIFFPVCLLCPYLNCAHCCTVIASNEKKKRTQ